MKFSTTLILSLLLTLATMAQKKVTLSGTMEDMSNGEEIIGGTIYVEELKAGTATNVYGFYSISLPPGTYTISFSYLGFGTVTKTVELKENTTLNIEMSADDVELEEVEVTAERQDQHVTSVEMSTEKMDIKTVKKMPALLGEPDIIKSAILLPGVTSVGEGASGFNVRGGNIDQNLILLDEAPVYNSSHLFGFFSVFNSDAIKDVKLYKGGIPAEYGGRLSSVMDVRQKDGNSKTFSGSGGISTIASKLTLEGPIVKDRSSFMVAGRMSYFGFLAKAAGALDNGNAYFYDLNGKFNYTLGEKDRLFISGYAGQDAFIFNEQFEFTWGNYTASIRWNHLFSEKLFSNVTGIYSNYNYSLGVPEGAFAFDWKSNIINHNLKWDLSYFINTRNTLKFGVSAVNYTFRPGEVDSKSNTFNDFILDKEYGLETGIYVSNEQKIGVRTTMQYGLRYSSFFNYGPTTVTLYENGEPLDSENPNEPWSKNDPIGEVKYDKYEVAKSYGGLEPRIGVNYLLNEVSSLKASYNHTIQYIHLVSNTTASVPVDVWKPAGTYVRPATADQIALGYFRNLKENTFEFSTEVYYKWFDDLLDYVDGAELLLNENLEQELIQGIGRAYGMEFMLRKVKGKTTGWIAYTLARTERQVNGINNGEYYPSNYDKPHDIAVVAMHQINERWDVSATFVYMTGRPITYPDGRYEIDGMIIPNYGNRNEARMDAYHRLDLAANYVPPKKRNNKWKGSWHFGLYNVYGRRNPYSISFRQEEDNPYETKAYQISILGSIVPSIGYNFKF